MDKKIIPFSITNVETNNWSMGHRFLGGELNSNPADYEKVMLDQFVMVDPAEKKEYNPGSNQSTRK